MAVTEIKVVDEQRTHSIETDAGGDDYAELESLQYFVQEAWDRCEWGWVKPNAAVARAVELLRAVDAYADKDDGFAQGNAVLGLDIWGHDASNPARAGNHYTYQSACGSALGGLTDGQRADALRLAGIDPELVGG